MSNLSKVKVKNTNNYVNQNTTGQYQNIQQKGRCPTRGISRKSDRQIKKVQDRSQKIFINKKIQIDPITTEEFTYKNTEFQNIQQINNKRPLTRQIKIKQRKGKKQIIPQRTYSKNQSRMIINSKIQQLKLDFDISRPQTSKGLRKLSKFDEKDDPIIPCELETKKINEQINNILITKKSTRLQMSAVTQRKDNNKYNKLKSSVDSQFLSLFAK